MSSSLSFSTLELRCGTKTRQLVDVQKRPGLNSKSGDAPISADRAKTRGRELPELSLAQEVILSPATPRLYAYVASSSARDALTGNLPKLVRLDACRSNRLTISGTSRRRIRDELHRELEQTRKTAPSCLMERSVTVEKQDASRRTTAMLSRASFRAENRSDGQQQSGPSHRRGYRLEVPCHFSPRGLRAAIIKHTL